MLTFPLCDATTITTLKKIRFKRNVYCLHLLHIRGGYFFVLTITDYFDLWIEGGKVMLAGRRLLSTTSAALIKRNMATVVPAALMNQLKATNGQSITCKAAVAWKPKTPLDITDIQVTT